MNTNIKVKQEHFSGFQKEVWQRLIRGREKYKIESDDTKEVTDVAADIEPDFMLGDMIKYIGEYKNTRNPKCLFDIAGFAFIKWLKDQK